MRQTLENRFFLLLLLLVSLAFFFVLEPFWGAIFWAAAITVIFFPLQERILRLTGHRRNLSALLTLLCCVVIVVLPVLLIVMQVVKEAVNLFQGIQEGDVSPGAILDQLRTAFPMVPEILNNFGIDTDSIRQRLSDFAVTASQYLAQETLSVGQNTMSLVLNLGLMLYLAFFLLRDGHTLIELFIRALPLGDEREHRLFDKFAEVTRATVKGNLVVAIVQGALGSIIFAILGIPAVVLWGVLMAVLSLIPAVGAALVWGPAAIYLIASGSWISGIVLVAYGMVVIGLADNILRPILVGRDTKLPDYIVLFSTLGGIALMGINGFVIGPLVAALFMTFWDIFMRDFNAEDESPY
ncbi:AI-2E family transporter [Saccharospirillum sp. MSK14-1]|uniref:AI-2E family transporter n=1 Tax=Saccharospirillum sp. MSK14-1 TaxID=1897632 RepID=UPI000D39E8C3|nr:AI-2E family transporter [Saccharospirillum sp. MSK14-1]PTY35693.1 AI-2E family transporter [Saccharospirillum sp. MSK14-1]